MYPRYLAAKRPIPFRPFIVMYRSAIVLGLLLSALLLPLARAAVAQQGGSGVGKVETGENGVSTARYRNASIVVRAARVTPKIDGVLEPGEWAAAQEITGFTQFQPDPDEPSTQTTRVWLLYDEKNLYIAFENIQPDEEIQAYLTRRDRLQGSPDFVGLLIDPFLTWNEGYLFLVNPAGVQTETMLGPDGNGDGAWDTLWKAEAALEEDRWTVEMAIPWSSLRFPKTGEQTWGINFIRSVGELSELSTYAPLDVGSNNLLTSNALFVGVQGVQPGRNIWLNPYTTMRTAREGLEETGSAWVNQRGLRYSGLDLRAGLSSNLILDATINPDFGHIEADQEQVNLTPYELFFPERRPFFVEGQRTFQMPINLFYSRRIHNPLAGVKLTGQVGGTQIGLVSAYDEPVSDIDDFPYAYQSVLRLKQDIGTASYIGGVVTSQEIPSQSRSGARYERNVGLDFNFRPSDRISLAGMAALAFEPGIGSRNQAYFANAGYVSETWRSFIAYADAQKDFDAYLGFLPRPNQQFIQSIVAYRHEADWGRVKFVTPNVRTTRYQKHSGELVDQEVVPGISIQTRANSNIELDAWFWDVRENGITHSGTAYTAQYNANRSGTWSGWAGFRLGEGFDYGDEEIVDDSRLWGGVIWRPTTRATFSLSGNYVRRSDGWTARASDVFRVLGFRAEYQFTRELFGKVFLQRRLDDMDRLTGSPDRRRRLLVNALLGYELGPGSVIYLAYNQFDSKRDRGLGYYEKDLGLGEPERVFFLKVARLFAF